MNSAKLTASLLSSLRSFESLESLLLLAVEALRDLPNLPFSEEWLKRINTPKREGYQKQSWFKRILPIKTEVLRKGVIVQNL